MNTANLELLGSMPVFEVLQPADLKIVSSMIITLEFEPGDLVFKEGAAGQYLCFVLSGELRVSKRTENGTEMEIASLGRGRSVGEMSLIDGLTCSATVTAVAPTVVLALTREQFQFTLTEHPQVGSRIFQGISRLLSISLRKTSADLASAKEQLAACR